MLKSLHIENIAVIEKTDIDFSKGLNVLTGETGAGKSIIIDSLNAVLGERTSKELIRNGCTSGEVTALFTDLSSESLFFLRENGYDVSEDNCLLIRRVLSLNGNGSIKINGKPATAAILREISKFLVNIHGQHDNQSLLNPDLHYVYIDRLGETKRLVDDYYTEFKKLNSIRKELRNLEINEDEKTRKTELLNYQISEIESANIKVGELEDLKNKLEICNSLEKTVKALSEAYAYLNGSDLEDGAVSVIRNSKKCISSLKSSDYEPLVSKYNEILLGLEDIASDIRDKQNSLETAGLDAEDIRNRIELLQRLIYKYGGSEEKCLEFLENTREELQNIILGEERIDKLSEELDSSTERIIALGDKLTAARKKTAERFSKEVTDILRYLDMPSVSFNVSVEKGRYTKVGCDVIEFKIITNIGDSEKPLHKIASGGELSRIMLAIKSVIANKDDVDTLIFDEIDTGISGRAAGKVGVQLKKVSQARQVICVTHLAQIAAFADSHLLIEKFADDNSTYTKVNELDEESRINEIARIMSGSVMSENIYKSAKELIDRSTNYENL